MSATTRRRRWRDIGGLTLRERVVALCLLVGIVLSGLGVAAATAASANNRHLDIILNKTGPMHAAGESLNAALVDQETAVRGFALSGDEADLTAYEQGQAAEARLLRQIEDLLDPGDVEVRRRLAVVRAAAQQWRAAVAAPIIAAVRHDGSAAGRALINDAARQRFQALRVRVADLQQAILAVRQQSSTAARQAGETVLLLAASAGGVVIIAGVGLLMLLDRLVSRPVVDLATQVRAVAGGAYDRRIVSVGSPELRGLAADIDAMRQQIADELSQVRETRSQIEWVNSQLQAQAAELTRSNRDLEQFAYVASHDLQEPLRKVASFCQLLQRRYAGQLDERADQYIRFAVDGAQRMQRLINDLLAFSRIGRIASGFVAVDLNEVLADVTSQLEERIGDGEVVWSELPTVEGEEVLLTTLFVNLVGNSLKFRRPQVPLVVRVDAQRHDREWEITVADNGIGIEPEFADKVFVIFQRLHPRDAYEGTGIGLAIVKKIVEFHGGRIWLGEAAEGAEIHFTLPVPIGFDEPSGGAVSAGVDSGGNDAGASAADEAAGDSAAGRKEVVR